MWEDVHMKDWIAAHHDFIKLQYILDAIIVINRFKNVLLKPTWIVVLKIDFDMDLYLHTWWLYMQALFSHISIWHGYSFTPPLFEIVANGLNSQIGDRINTKLCQTSPSALLVDDTNCALNNNNTRLRRIWECLGILCIHWGSKIYHKDLPDC